jgi:hypothetical protein
VERAQVIDFRPRTAAAPAAVRAPGAYVPVLDHLDVRMRDLVARQHIVFVAGARTSVHRGPAGFVRVVGRRLLVWPDRDRLIGEGGVRLVFVDLFRDVASLHVEGRARTVDGWARVHVERAHLRTPR